MKVVGTMNKSRRYAPNFCLNPEINNIDPKIKQTMAKNNKNGAKEGGTSLFDKTSTVFSKFIILPGTA